MTVLDLALRSAAPRTILPRAAAGPAGRRTARALVATAVVVNAAVLVVGTTYATFSGKQTVAQTSSAGTVSIVLTTPGSATVTSGVTGLAAGDSFQRLVTVAAGTGLEIGSWTLSTVATTSSALDTDVTNGLRLAVDRCDQAWTESVSGDVRTYACPGQLTSALSEDHIIRTKAPLGGLSGAPGTANHLRLTVKLAATAPDDMQGLSSTLTYTFAGVQRAGRPR